MMFSRASYTFEVLVADPDSADFAWLIPQATEGMRAKGRNNKNCDMTILAKLGTFVDPDTICRAAREICKQQMRRDEALYFLSKL